MLATVCGNQANVALMQHRHEQALALAERSVELQEQAGTPHGLGVALASLGQICVRLGQSEARRGGAQPRARRAQPAAVHARDDRRGLRHAGADSPDSRRPRGGQPQPAAGARGLRRDAREPLVSVVGAGARGAPRAAARRCRPARWRSAARSRAAPRDAPAVYALQAELIAVEALLALGRHRRGAAAARGDRPRDSSRGAMSGIVGGVPAAARPAARRGRPRDRGVPRLRPERQRLRAARRALPGRPQLPRARPAGRRRRARARARPAT